MALIKYILVFITGCAFANGNANDSVNRMEDLQFTYLEPSSHYLVADGVDEVKFTLKNNRGIKIKDFILFYSFNDSAYKPLEKHTLTTKEVGDFKVYAQPLKRTKSMETLVHAREKLKSQINISKSASIKNLYLEDKGKKVKVKDAKYFDGNKEIKDLSQLGEKNDVTLKVYLNNSKLGKIDLKLFDIKLEVDKVELKAGESLALINPRINIEGNEKPLRLEDLIVKNMDFSLRQNINKKELEAGTYFISAEVELNEEKVQVNEREIVVNYDTDFKSAQIIPLPTYLVKLNELNFRINNIPFLKRNKNLYLSDSMLIYRDNNKFLGFIIGDLISSSTLDIFNEENIIDSLTISGNREMVKLSSNKAEWPGLINLGNTCFFNSAVKALASTSALDSQLETDYEKNIEIRSLIRALINAIRLGKESPFYLSNDELNSAIQKELIQKILIAISDLPAYERVDDRRQHDCSEVLTRILEAVMIEDNINLNGTIQSLNSLEIENTPDNDKYQEAKKLYEKKRSSLKNLSMTQLFLKDSQIKITEKLSFEPISYEFFKFFGLGKTPTVQELVNINLGQDETIEGFSIDPIIIVEKGIPKEDYIIKNNEKYFINITKVKKVLEISDYFILNVNRKLTNSKEPKIELKDERKILKVKEIINLPYFDYLSKTDKTLEFEPIACTVHIGGSNGGHYIAYIKEKETGKWYVNNDSSVNEEELTDNVGTIYSIVYEKR